MSTETKPATPDGSEESGLRIFLRVIGLLVIGPALVLYLVSLVAR